MTNQNEQPSPGEKPQIEIASDEDWKTRVKAEDARLDAERSGSNQDHPADASGSDRTVADDSAAPTATDESPELNPAGDSSAPADAADEMDFNPADIPPASFTMLVQMFSTQAMVALGVIPSPDGKQKRQLALAKHFIDLMAVLDVKCQGNLDSAEANLLEQSLHELRMAYIQLSKSP